MSVKSGIEGYRDNLADPDALEANARDNLAAHRDKDYLSGKNDHYSLKVLTRE